jgi:serine/threonine-protein kinase
MGAILRGRDPDLGREMAVKVLLDRHRDNAEMVRRFVEEAQIGGQLQHPGLVPIYELGTFADRRPFFSMKLVKGHTLAQLLEGCNDPAEDLPRFLSIFESVAQTVAYAHARGVIHRDLKPSNVMVGSFGEVQVMDWGLAKVLPRGGIADDAQAGKPAHHETVIATARSGGDGDTGLSHAGSVMGTPAYMAPEQARGEVDRIDERADVFALGAILCEVLTDEPAFLGRTAGEIQRRAALGDLADAIGRLDACGADKDLIALAKDCLAREPEDRPRDARVVAGRVTTYLAGVQARVQAAERERAVAVARAVEERRRRRLQLGLATAVLAFTTLGGLSTTYYLQQRQARAAARDRIVAKAATLLDEAAAHADDVARWQVALAAVDQSESSGDAELQARLAVLRTRAQAGLDAVRRDRALLDRLVDIRSAEADDPDGSATEHGYTDGFREAGLDLSTMSPSEAGAKIRARTPAVVLAIAAGLDDWTNIRRIRGEVDGVKHLTEVAQSADPDPWRNELRTALLQRNKMATLGRLSELARSASFDSIGPVSLDLLARTLVICGDPAAAETVLRKAQRRHPDDVWVNFGLARVLEKRARREEAIRYYTAARTIRPETAHELAHALDANGESDEAIEVFQDLARLRPKVARHLTCLGAALQKRGRSREAIVVLDQAVTVLREAIRARPDDALAHNLLGLALKHRGRLNDAIAEYREAIRLKPGDVGTLVNLGGALHDQGEHEEAAAVCRKAILLQPREEKAFLNLGNALESQGKLDEAIVAFREAIRLSPDYVDALIGLGRALTRQGKHDEAGTPLREAIRLKPDEPSAHFNLGMILAFKGRLDDAIAEYREAIRLSPDEPVAHNNLGMILAHEARLDDAIAEYREAIRLKPGLDLAHANLGLVLLLGRRDPEEALAELRRAAELAAPGSPVSQGMPSMIREAEAKIKQVRRLPGILRGEDAPRNASEGLSFALLAHQKGLYSAATRLWSAALAAEHKLAEDRTVQPRYDAACSAALGGCGKGKDAPAPDEAARASLRKQALDWLKAELATWTKLFETEPTTARQVIVKTLKHWREDSDLAGVRDAEALARLPADEKKAWQALWADVASLQSHAATPTETDAKSSGTTPVWQDAVPAESRPSAPTRRSLAPATPKTDDAEVLDRIHKRAHELAASKPAEAEPLFREALEGYRKVQGPDGALTLDLTLDLANLLYQSGRGAEAEPLFRTALGPVRKRFGPGDPRTVGILAPLGLSLIQQEKWAEAEAIPREGLAIREKVQPDEWTTFNTRSLLGGSLLGQ